MEEGCTVHILGWLRGGGTYKNKKQNKQQKEPKKQRSEKGEEHEKMEVLLEGGQESVQEASQELQGVQKSDQDTALTEGHDEVDQKVQPCLKDVGAHRQVGGRIATVQNARRGKGRAGRSWTRPSRNRTRMCPRSTDTRLLAHTWPLRIQEWSFMSRRRRRNRTSSRGIWK